MQIVVTSIIALFLLGLFVLYNPYRTTGETVKNIEESPELNSINELKNESKNALLPATFQDSELEGYQEMKLNVVPGKIFLSNGCKSISFSTTLDKTNLLIKSIEGTYEIRPNDYDVLEEIMDVFNIKLEYLAIDEVKDEIFYAHLILYNKDSVLNMDIKPSDGLAIASRFKAPVFVSQQIIEEYAEDKCSK